MMAPARLIGLGLQDSAITYGEGSSPAPPIAPTLVLREDRDDAHLRARSPSRSSEKEAEPVNSEKATSSLMAS